MDISGEWHLDVKHDIIKRRLDSHGNVIETRQDVIGAPKVCYIICFLVHLWVPSILCTME
uniref:Endoplasmic reticulum-Golgi intermediate compartment protein 3 n=1 Tax=Rhizophora mucronata TaxID=61149 RepID=A0A2P2IHX2_RHIMU